MVVRREAGSVLPHRRADNPPVLQGTVKASGRLVFHMAGVLAKDGKIEYCGATISRNDHWAFCSTLEKVK